MRKNSLKLRQLAQNDRQAVLQFSSRMHQLFGSRIRFIKLFGSKARGSARKFSDIDLFVLIDHISSIEEHKVTELEVEIDLKYDVVLSPIVYTFAEYRDPRRQIVPFFKQLAQEGIAV